MKYLGIFLFSIFLVSCYSESEEELFPVVDTTPKDTTSGLTVSFASQIAPLISTNCAIQGCHESGAQTPTFETYIQISASKDRIKARAINSDPSRMPPPERPALTSNEINLLRTWLDEGARNN